jgi:DNA polymerase
MFGPVVPSVGPSNARIFILAEAPGEKESELGQPLVGPSGLELRRMLNTVGISLDDCYKANVFSRRPADNNIALYGQADPHPDTKPYGPLTSNPITYLRPEFLSELERVYREICAVNPNVLLALGNTATWALGLGTGITAIRGSVQVAHLLDLGRPLKVLPTFHPAMILRQWDQRVIALADLEKCVAESLSPELSFDNTTLWLNPTLADLLDFDRDHMEPALECAADIETKRGQITAISFSPEPSVSLAIPFWLEGPNPNYWASIEEEFQAWTFVRKWMERPDLVKVFQNGLYDLQYLSSICTPRNCSEDTMIAHHSLYTELRKGLGFLGSIYSNTPSWKSMRTFRKEEQLKRDD